MRSPAKEARDPNRVGPPAATKRGTLGGLEGSPAKKRGKLSKKDRRRVSFAPDPELTLVHHFVKDDDYSSNSGGKVVVATYEDEDPSVALPQPAGQHYSHPQEHPALAGAPDGAYRPGFWNKTVPENSPLSDVPLAQPDSPDMVSMELTQPTLVQAQQPAGVVRAAHVPGEVTAGLPTLGALAEADELEEVEQGAAAAAPQQQQQQQAWARVPGEETAALPSLGALAQADEWEEGDAQAAAQRQVAAASWAGMAVPGGAAGNVTANITAALPGLGDLVEEDEDDAAGMDLTLPAGRVLEHNPQQEQHQHQLEGEEDAGAAVAATAGDLPEHPAVEQSPAPTAVVAAAEPSPVQEVQQQLQQSGGQQEEQQPHPAPPAETAPAAASAAAMTGARMVGRPSLGRLSVGGTDELVQAEAARAVQRNKWGFAPGQDDTLELNLEMHGRMIMGDQTFNRMYCDTTTGDGGYGHAGSADDTGNSLVLAADDDGQLVEAAAAAEAEPAATSSHGDHQHPQPSPAPLPGGQPAEAEPAAAAPNWTAPAFLPPYLQAPAASGAPSDHPALVQSPAVTGSSLNTLETRRVSVGMDMRRASISSRRFSMQDATGRLLADDDMLDAGAAAAEAMDALSEGEMPAALPPVGGPPSAGPRTRRCSSGAAFIARDVTEKLLVDDESLDADVGPLADLKRQMRMLSQGSPLLAPQPEAAAAVAAVAAAEEAEVAGGAGAAGEQAQLAPAVAAVAKTPRTAVSMGYADSHNPATATARLLRSGGTTRLLLQDSLDEEEDMLAKEGAEALEGGRAAAAAVARGGGSSMEERLQMADAGGITARTNGTTKLLADMTMASVVGAKLGRLAQGTPELAHGPNNDGLTDFSLDQFEPPPELPGQQAAPAGAEVQQQLPAAPAEEQQYAQAAAQQQHQQAQMREAAVDGYASPALPPAGGEFAAGYPVAHEAGGSGDIIPGGPKLARTPVTARPASLPRAAHGTPYSNPRSVRSQQQQHHQHQHHHQHATPGTHGTHRLARTPGSVRAPPAAYYPMEADPAADNVIPGGPKLARTPVGRTPATGGGYHHGAGAPGSAVAQHYPGSARAVHFAAGPSSASMQRYPGSAVAPHRSGGGLTPQQQFAPPPMTFQDFARLAEVQFLDNLRRGASINYADLQPNPVPANLAEAYRLLTIISPQVSTLENGIRILQEEVQGRRVSAADAEQLVGQVNPAAFQKAATADDEGLEALREHVGLLKKVCRQKAVYCLKDVRRQMEESRGGRLQRNLEALQADLALAQSCRDQLDEVVRAAEQYIADQHRRMAQEDQAVQEQAERRTAVAGMRQAMHEEAVANEQRRCKLAQAQERVAKLREEHAALHREREALHSRTDALQMTLMQSQGQGSGLGQVSSPASILQELEELDALKRCVGWELESAAEDPVSGEVALRLAGLFRLRLSISRAGATAAVEVLPEEECKVPADQRALLAALAGCAEEAPAEVRVSDVSGARVAALVQAITTRFSRVAGLLGELDGLRLAFPALTEVACSPDGCVALSFVNLDAEVKFSVSLHLPASYPAGQVQHQAKIWFGDEGRISEHCIEHAVAAPAEVPGRLRAICSQLSQLARKALPRPALTQDAAGFHSNWQNPLFGSTPAQALSAQ